MALLQSVDAQTALGLPRCAVFCRLLLAGPTAIPLQLLKCSHCLVQEQEKEVSLQLRLSQGALGRGEADRQALISQHAAALEQQGQHVKVSV